MSALIDKVAQKLGISREAAADRVGEFVDQIRSVVDDGSPAEVEGLGKFTSGEDGLSFTPDSRLAAVVNHRFAGLAPIPVESVAEAGPIDESSFALPDIPIAVPHDMGASSEREDGPDKSDGASDVAEDMADGAIDHEVDPGGVSAVGAAELDTQAPAVGNSILGEEPAETGRLQDADAREPIEQPTATEAAEAAEAAAVAGAGDYDADVADEVGDGVAGSVQDTAAITGDGSEIDDRSAADPGTSAGEAAERGQPPPAVVKRKSRALFYFAMIVVLVLAIAGVLYLISLGDSSPTDRQDELVESDAGVAPGGSVGTEAAEVGPPLITWEPGAIDRRAGGYTLIVSSQETVDEAAAVALELSQQLADEDLPVDVLTGTARGQTWYRVAIGQYSRQSVATRELRRLAEKLPEGAWVLRIRTNM
ncbi:MAG: SPOR domain-containing protein [Rhodothermia bacterium]|nr:SPOR domain-containing protein [Rhodothermia bacterium]